MKKGKELNNLFKTLRYQIYANRTNNGTPEGCKQAMADSTKIEELCDEFAIGFAEWCTKYIDKNRNVYGEMLHAKSKYDETYLTRELLQIYKKEKGL